MKRILEKIYVKVNSDFDSTGYMMPRTITWADGRTFKIDEVKDFRPASTLAKGHSGDCYTVVIRGEEKFLFFEKTDDLFASRVGRWTAEKAKQKRTAKIPRSESPGLEWIKTDHQSGQIQKGL